MNTAELIVELVLTGLLMLAVLLLPAYVHSGGNLVVDGDVGVVLAIASGFLLGVVIDRCTDSILALWEARLRCQFAWKDSVIEDRDRLEHLGAELRDPFPEDWLRNKLATEGPESSQRQADQLRVRIRITRTVTLLTPALATSWILAVWARSGPPIVVWLPGLHLLMLLGVSIVGDQDALKPPRTNKVDKKVLDDCSAKWLKRSPATLWYALQIGFALVVTILALCTSSKSPWEIPAIAVGGATLTVLAYRSWSRISVTFMTLVWKYSVHRQPKDLVGVCFDLPAASPLPLQDRPFTSGA